MKEHKNIIQDFEIKYPGAAKKVNKLSKDNRTWQCT